MAGRGKKAKGHVISLPGLEGPIFGNPYDMKHQVVPSFCLVETSEFLKNPEVSEQLLLIELFTLENY